MIEIDFQNEAPKLIDFGSAGKVLFQLPVLGGVGVPMGITSAFALFWDKYSTGGKMTEREVAQAWNLLITTLADTHPDATRQLARLDGDNLAHVLKKWVEVSGEQGGFDPKAA